MEIYRKGFIVAAWLGILTVGEYFAADGIEDDLWRFLVLAVGTVAEGILIVWYYMHVYRLWKTEEAH